MPTDPYRLGLSVTHADGRVSRWGPDELASSDVPTGLIFSSSVPGGWKDATCSLLRNQNASYSDEALFDDLRVYGPGNETAWNGRMVQFPRQHADQFSVQPGAVGWVAHLQDDPSFREIYVDRDLSRWGPVSSKSRTDNPTFLISDGQVRPDETNGLPGLWTIVEGGPASAKAWCISMYDALGIDIGAVYYDWINFNISLGDATYTIGVSTNAQDDEQGVGVASGDLQPVGVGAAYLPVGPAGQRYAWVQWFYNALSSWPQQHGVIWRKLALYGKHGLTPRGADPGGFYASDVIADIVARTAPLLTFTTGLDGSITPTTFAIPHLVFADPTTGSDAITLVDGYHLFEWGVYDNREFFWRPPDPARCTWTARLSDGAQISLEGDDANNIFNGVYVTYQDPSGKRKTVGPPGSVADATDASLVDTDPANPVNAHGIPRRWGKLEISTTTTPAGAIQLGAVWLAEHRLPARRGQLTLTGLVEHPTRGKRPVWAVRAGDFVRIADRPGDPPRRIIEASYDHDSRRATLSLDQTVFKIEALFERLGAGLVGVL